MATLWSREALLQQSYRIWRCTAFHFHISPSLGNKSSKQRAPRVDLTTTHGGCRRGEKMKAIWSYSEPASEVGLPAAAWACTRANSDRRIVHWLTCNSRTMLWVFGFIWKLWACSFKWGMVACSPHGNYRVPSPNVEVPWLRPAQLRKP